jgi:hypothetical protein
MSHASGTNDVGTLDPGQAHAPLAVGTSVGPPRGSNGPALGPGVDGCGRLVDGRGQLIQTHPDEAVPGCPHLPACRSYCPAIPAQQSSGRSATATKKLVGPETEPTTGTPGPPQDHPRHHQPRRPRQHLHPAQAQRMAGHDVPSGRGRGPAAGSHVHVRGNAGHGRAGLPVLPLRPPAHRRHGLGRSDHPGLPGWHVPAEQHPASVRALPVGRGRGYAARQVGGC